MSVPTGSARLAVVDRLAVAATTATGTNRMMTAEVGLPASQAVIAHAEERFGDVVAELLPIRRQMHRFGGSHAQRDVLQRTCWTLPSVTVSSTSPALTAERLGVRDTSVYSWMQRARCSPLRATRPARRRRARRSTAIAALAQAG